MKEKKDSTLKFFISVLTDSLSIGIAVVGSIIAGAVIGWLIEEKLLKGKTFPWITTIFIIFGAAGGIKNLIWYSKKRMREAEEAERGDERDRS